MVDFSELSQTTPLRTRGGLDVIEWWLQEDTPDSFFPIRAKVRLDNGKIEEYPYMRSGRRYINTESRYDLAIRKHKKHKRRTLQMGDRPDVMPDVLRAIACVRKKDFAGVKSANKRSDYPSLNETIIYNYTIGCSDGGLD